MKKVLISLIAILIFAAVPTAASAGSYVSEMAAIMMHLNHYPSPAEKKGLESIANDPKASEGEKSIAGALMRMQHQVAGMDADKLRMLAASETATAVEKELASILLGMAHYPSKQDIERLKDIAE